MISNLKDIYQHTIILAEDIACAIAKLSTERMILDDAYDNLGGATERKSESLIFVEEALENLGEALASLTLDAKFIRENWEKDQSSTSYTLNPKGTQKERNNERAS